MKKISLGGSGPSFSQICYGVWRLTDDPKQAEVAAALKKIETCLEMGITTFDHADIYGDYSCEALFGKALAEQPHLRDSMQLVTKAGIKLISANRPDHKIKSYDTGAEHLTSSLECSLKLLNVEQVDLFLIHRPDPFMDVDATAAALNKLVKSGKTKFIGVSNFTPSQFELLDSRMDQPLVTNQIELSCLNMNALNDGTLDQAMRLKRAPMAWSPLGGGRLFQKNDPLAAPVQKVLQEIGAKYDADIAQMALAWLLNHPARIIPIIGSNNIERICSMAKSTEIVLTREEWFEIWQAAAGHEVP